MYGLSVKDLIVCKDSPLVVDRNWLSNKPVSYLTGQDCHHSRFRVKGQELR